MNVTNTIMPSTASSGWRLVLVMVGLMLGVTAVTNAVAATPATTPITNRAQASFTDANGNGYTSESNVATIIVKEVFSASIASDNLNLTGAVGETKSFVHTLTNLGNSNAAFTFDIAQDNAAEGAPNNDFTNLKACVDLDNSGVLESGETTGGSAVCATPGVPVASYFLDANGAQPFRNIIVQGTIPAGAVQPEDIRSILTVSFVDVAAPDVVDTGSNDDGLDETNQDQVIVTGGASLAITKTGTVNTAVVPNEITYTIRVTNNGNAPAYDVEIQDGLDPAFLDVVDATSILSVSSTGDFVDGAAANEDGADWTRVDAGPPVTAGLCQVYDGTPANCLADATGVTGSAAVATTDVDGNGTEDGAAALDIGVRAHDDVLPPNTFIEVTFTVAVKSGLNAGDIIPNTATFEFDGDDDDTTAQAGETGSATFNTTAPQNFAVRADDTGPTASPGVNDGGDDDNTLDDVQLVDTISSGGAVRFDNIITNLGNGQDVFELSVVSTAAAITAETTAKPSPGALADRCAATTCLPFPAGTVFTLADEFGNPLANTGGTAAGVDTGTIASGLTKTIRVIATLPAAFATPLPDTEDYVAILTATSNGDPTQTDTKAEVLETVVGAVVDLSNGTTDATNDTDDHPFDPAAATTNSSGSLGGVPVVFPLTIKNEGGVSDSFQIDVYSGYNTTTSATVALHADWAVNLFTDATCVTPLGGTATPVIPPEGETVVYACVTLPPTNKPASGAVEAGTFDTDADGVTAAVTIDGGTIGNAADGDGDYPIVFVVTGTGGGAIDVKMDAVDVNENEVVILNTGAAANVQPGGSIDYPHTLANTGNTSEVISVGIYNDNTTFFSNNLLVDDDCNAGTPPVSLVIGGDVCVTTADLVTYPTGTRIATFGDDLGATIDPVAPGPVWPGSLPTIALDPLESIDITVRVFAAAGTPNNATDNATLSVSYDIGTDDDVLTNVDTTTTLVGNVRLKKMGAPDHDCDGAPSTSAGASVFNDLGYGVNNTSVDQVAPGECVIWQIVANNNGTQPAENVVITDTATTFTLLRAETLGGATAGIASLYACQGDAGTNGSTGCTTAREGLTIAIDTEDADAFAIQPAADDNNPSAINGSADGSGNVTFTFDSLNGTQTAGTLLPGQTVTMQFLVTVQ